MYVPVVEFLKNDSLGFGKVEIRFDHDPESRIWITGIKVIKDKQLGYFLSNPRNTYTGGFRDYDYQYDMDDAILMLRAGMIDDIICDNTGEVYCAIYRDRDYATKTYERAMSFYGNLEFGKHIVYGIRTMTVPGDFIAIINTETGRTTNLPSYYKTREEAEEMIKKIYARSEKFKGANYDADTLCHMIDTDELNFLDVYAIEHASTGDEVLRVQACLIAPFEGE